MGGADDSWKSCQIRMANVTPGEGEGRRMGGSILDTVLSKEGPARPSECPGAKVPSTGQWSCDVREGPCCSHQQLRSGSVARGGHRGPWSVTLTPGGWRSGSPVLVAAQCGVVRGGTMDSGPGAEGWHSYPRLQLTFSKRILGWTYM